MATAPKPRTRKVGPKPPARVNLIATVDGADYPLRAEALSAMDVAAFRRATGCSRAELYAVLTDERGTVDLDTVAQVVWLSLWQQKKAPDWETIAGQMVMPADEDEPPPGIRFATDAESDAYDGIGADAGPEI